MPLDIGHQCYSAVVEQQQVSPKASPRAIFKWKNLIEPLKLLPNEYNEWKVENCCKPAPLCAIPCQHGPTLQFASCAEKNRLSGTVMMAWILTCLDQCHGVGSHGTSSSQGWPKELLYSLQSKFDRWVYILDFRPKVIVAGLPRKAFPRK